MKNFGLSMLLVLALASMAAADAELVSITGAGSMKHVPGPSEKRRYVWPAPSCEKTKYGLSTSMIGCTQQFTGTSIRSVTSAM